MADSDRSRSPVHARNRPDQRSARPPAQLPGFPRWRGPMGAAVRASMNMRGPQMTPWMHCPPGTYGCGPCCMTPSWTGSQFPPTPPSTPRSSTPYPRPLAPQLSQCPPTQPCTPSFSPSQPRSTGSSPMQSSPVPQNHEAPRVYGFDLNTSWQPDKDHYDNQKINGLTLPRSIRPSAFTQKLDIEMCFAPQRRAIFHFSSGQMAPHPPL